MATRDLREWADRQFDKQKTADAKEKRAASERETAAREIRAKTERLRAMRLAKEAADKVALDVPQAVPGNTDDT